MWLGFASFTEDIDAAWSGRRGGLAKEERWRAERRSRMGERVVGARAAKVSRAAAK